MKNVPNIKIYKYNNIPKNTIKGLFKFLCRVYLHQISTEVMALCEKKEKENIQREWI